jgi:hypothetical protein
MANTPNKEEIELIKSQSLLNAEHQWSSDERKLSAEESENAGDEHTSCRDSSEENVNMQELLQQEKEEEIIEEDIIPFATGKKTPRVVLSFGNPIRDVGQYVLFTYQI